MSSNVTLEAAEARSPVWRRAVVLAVLIAVGAILLHVGNLFLALKQQHWLNVSREEVSRERAAVGTDRVRIDGQLAQFEHVKGQIAELNSQAQALSIRIDGLRNQARDLDQMKQQRDQAVTEREQALEAHRRAEGARGEADAAMRRTTAELERIRSATQNAQGEFEKLARQAATMQDELRRLQGERSTAEAATRAATAARQAAESQTETAVRTQDKARQDSAAGQRELDTLRAALATQRLEVTAAEARRVEADRAAQAVQERARQAQSTVDEVEAQRRRLLDEVKRLRDEQASIQASTEAAQLRETDLRRRVVTLQTAFEETERARQTALQERANLAGQIDAAKIERSRLQDLSAERQTITRAITETQAQLAPLRAELVALRRNQEQAQAELIRTQQAAEGFRVLRAEQERQRGELADQLVRLQAQRDTLDKERTTVMGEVTQAETRLADLRRQAAAANASIMPAAENAVPSSQARER